MTVSPDEPSAATGGPGGPASPIRLSGPNGPVSPVLSPPTEERNPRTLDIDVLPARDVLELLNDEDQTVPGAVRAVLGTLALVVEEAERRMRRGGHVHYFGAGSSGRMAVLDAAELVPTFGLDPDLVVAHLAGGATAMTRAIEGAEDDEVQGARDAGGTGPADVVIGLSASGRTPYVAGVLEAAAACGAFTAVVTCDPRSPLIPLVAAALVAQTGPEAIAGSTRLKATTAMKLILNSFSTALMIRLGKTYSNLMVEVSASNSKLRGRKARILREASGAELAECEAALTTADGDLQLAMVMLLGGVPADQARRALLGRGNVRGALAALLHFSKKIPIIRPIS